MTVPDRREVTTALLAMLSTAVAVPVGDHEAPSQIEPDRPWIILHSVPGGEFHGSLQNPESDAQFVYRIESAGRSREQCEWCADNVRRTMLARSAFGEFQVGFPDTSPWRVNHRRSAGVSGGVEVEGNPPDRVFSSSEDYVICVTPS